MTTNAEKEALKLYNMNLHETYLPVNQNGNNYYQISRVPGGWIYESMSTKDSLVFVPYSPLGFNYGVSEEDLEAMKGAVKLEERL